MVLKQFFPKSLTFPNIRYYNFDGLTTHMLKSYLATVPVADRIYGAECFISKDKFEPFFIAESHMVNLPIKKTESKLILREYGNSSCYLLLSNKSSVFPFTMSESPINEFQDITSQIKDDELIILQVLAIKKQTEFYQNKLWDQYLDYLNGVEYPTNNKILRSIQQKILEFQKKIEGGYRRNQRIDETEKKLKEDMFQTEVRFMVFGSSRESRRKLGKLVHSKFSKVDYVNSWLLSEDKDIRGYFEDVQLRRPSLSYPKQILCTSELVNLLMVSNTLITKTEEIIPIVETTTETPIPEEGHNNPFAIFPRGTKKVRENDPEFVSRFNQALKKLKLTNSNVVVQDIQHGATVQTIIFSLPAGLKLSVLTKAVDDIQTEIGLSGIGIKQGDLAGTAALVIPQLKREQVFLRDCVETLTFKEFYKKADCLPFIIGVDNNGETVFDDLVRIRHLLIVGTSGSGKSVFLNSMLTVMMALTNPRDIKFFMVDPKKVELKGYSNYPHVQTVITNMDEAEGILMYLIEQMENRYKIFEQKDYKTIQHHNRNESKKLEYMVLVVEEMSDLMLTNPEVEDHIIRIAQLGRAAGIHLIIATQYPIGDVITPLIKRNIISRICFALDDAIAYRVALGDGVPKNLTLLGMGHGIYKLEGIQGMHQFQGALIGKNNEEDNKIIKALCSFWKVQGNKEVIDLEDVRNRKRSSEIKEFKKIVLEKNETRVTELQNILEIRQDKVSRFMNELVEIGWVKKNNSLRNRYQLILNEEQRRQELEKLK